MFKFNNTHIFTGYLKQLLSSVNIPTCKIYTSEFARYLEQHGEEDPRILESFDTLSKDRLATRVNYLKDNELYNYFWDTSNNTTNKPSWKRVSTIFYESSKNTPGLTKTLYSPGGLYDEITHEYLGEYLRFLRDYHNINLMSLYNCYNDKVCTNINNFTIELTNYTATFDSRDSEYKIYAIPVKLFSSYTIAVDSTKGLEMFCGFFNNHIDTSDKAIDLATKTYTKINKTIFTQPFLYEKLSEDSWKIKSDEFINTLIDAKKVTRWDIVNREQDLRLFIKIPTSSKSSIVVLEGDFRYYNDTKYTPDRENQSIWKYSRNHSIINFGSNTDIVKVNTNSSNFKPISKLQLLAFNTGESYPFADRLIEYLVGSAITPIDEISDNIKRAQKVMRDNKHYFKIEGLWENKMQKIIYDYLINTGPVVAEDGKLIDKRQGNHHRLGHKCKSTLYDVLGYVDKDAEKWYASWKIDNGKINKNASKAVVKDTIQNVDIYVDKNGKSLWDI